jgi:dihydroxy-acid dehydratase
VNAAIGGSTNAVIHLIAIARRIGVKLALDDWDKFGRGVHTLVNLMPNGKYLMEDFCYAGGLPVVIRELGERGLLNKEAITANGKTIWENNREARNDNPDVIMPFAKPFKRDTGIAVLRGNLCPDGAIIKPSAATPKLMKHRGPAVVFENIEDFHARVDDPKLKIDENSVMVLKNCGPKGYPGMAEVGNMPLPAKLLKKGITDMVRISDARMSGTAYGTVVLHAAPEAAAGGPLALVKDGDPDRARRRQAQAPSPRERWGARKAPRGVEGAEATDGARVLEALCRSREPSERGRRSRFPGGQERFCGSPR